MALKHQGNAWIEIQKATFTAWVNAALGSQIKDLVKEIGDGLTLIKLAEVLSGKSVGAYNKTPAAAIQKAGNLATALDFFLHKEGIKLVNIGAEDLTAGKVDLILGLIWTLILYYDVQGHRVPAVKVIDATHGNVHTTEAKGKGKEKTEGFKTVILEWVRSKLPGKTVSNLNKDWRDGSLIYALVAAVGQPEAILPASQPADALSKAKAASKAATDALKVPAVLAPEHLVSDNCDELSLVTYLAGLRNADITRTIAAHTAIAASSSFGRSVSAFPALASGAAKTAAKVPESFAKTAAIKEAHAVAHAIKATQLVKTAKAKRQDIFARARKYATEYARAQQTQVKLAAAAKKAGSLYVEPEAKLLFVIRIRGINHLPPKARKVLQLFRLLQINNGVFLRVNLATKNMLKFIEPYVTYGAPTLKTVKQLIYKRGYGRVGGSRIRLSDNAIIEKALGKYNIICIEDLIHEIFTVGPHFKEANSFLWTFKLNTPNGGWKAKLNHFSDGGDFGSREHFINDLVAKMN